ncbi:MAG: hypothetical protein CVT99_16355 [Bacteroidetes bacterium HGW-Bacteroidetes-16]|jgi:hypothetical protein|nr:MAG: hypothetical protein CVT99_16355 [Bacteroidetes bacterium HGW-Bacteroidetes-16]
MIHPDLWNISSNSSKGKGDEAQILKNYLSSLTSKAQRQYSVLESLGQEITADAIKNALKDTSEKKLTLLEVFNYHNEQLLSRVNIIGTKRDSKISE